MARIGVGFQQNDGSRTVEALDELPGFWTFFHIRHPDVKLGAPSSAPLGFIPAGEIDEKVADTIRAYVQVYAPAKPRRRRSGGFR